MKGLNLTFSGAGFLTPFHFGALTQLGRRVNDVKRFGGSSGGALASAIALLCPERIYEANKMFIDFGIDVNSRKFSVFSPNIPSCFDMLKTKLDDFVPNDISYSTDRLFICITNMDKRESEIISKFSSKNDLIDALLCSCHIPLWSNRTLELPKFRGKKYIDGGFIDLIPNYKIPEDEILIKVAPFSIKPKLFEDTNHPIGIHPLDEEYEEKYTIYSNVEMKKCGINIRRIYRTLFPPNEILLRTYFELGRKYAKEFDTFVLNKM
ncbi:hypothetical protein SNEBB_001092 [Seison nebaliae]|nr:hypothetical protein SNEBB_001092 [Seison nebaliae]